MRMALVDDKGIVKNVIVYDPSKEWNPPAGLTLVEVNDWVNIDDAYDKPLPPPPPHKTEEERKQERNAAAKNELSLIASFNIEKKTNPNISFSDFLDGLESSKPTI
jgi:hypothetical protein